MNFLIATTTPPNSEVARRASSEKQSDFIMVLNMLSMVSMFLKESVKMQLMNFDSQ